MRIEKKFEIDERKKHVFLDWLWGKSNFLKHHQSRQVSSVYYDTQDRKSLNDNLIGISTRNKFRVRWYSPLNSVNEIPKTIQAEFKYRQNNLGGKNVTELDKLKTSEIIRSNFNLTSKGLEELEEKIFLPKYFFNCSPFLRCSYLREYFIDETGLRLTVDRDLSFSDSRSLHLGRSHEHHYSKLIVEVKFPEYLSVHTSRALRHFPLRTVRNSKYVLGSAILGDCVYL